MTRRITETFTISLPPKMAREVEEAMKRDNMTRSELVRVALRGYLEKKRGPEGPLELT